MSRIISLVLRIFFAGLLLSGCTTRPPANLNNLCSIFYEKDDWHEAAQDSESRWGTEVPILMAFMHQESRFIADNQPRMNWFLFVPTGRASSAYGYAQALDSTWKHYQRDTGNWGADRDDFDDAIDFIGWYNSVSYRRNKIRRNDAYHLYLAYHEGHGGFNKRSFRNKTGLKRIAKKVSRRAAMYRRQYAGCKAKLSSRGGWF